MKKAKREGSLRKKLSNIVIGLLVPLVLCIVIMLAFVAYYTVLCSRITHNVGVCSEFSLDFKENMDLKMYHYVVGSREQPMLPIGDLNEAIDIARSLQKTTERRESQKAIRNVINYCSNLRDKMYEIERTGEYDIRQIQLENNIYVLTGLIQEEMSKYIYYEAAHLADFETDMMRSITIIIVAIGVIMIVAVLFVISRLALFIREISVPISMLCDNVNQVGEGNFDIRPVETTTYEIHHLDYGIQQMAQRICVLLEDVKKEEQEQNKIHMQLLQEQINPHFLYNTLDTIVWLVECNRGSEATLMLTNLSSFFRTTLSKGENIITLDEEIRHTRSYLDIQQVRYRDIMDYDIVLPDNLKNVLLPKITIQPLVENALYHGIKCKRGNGTIRVKCEDLGDEVNIIIADNGIGMTKEKLEALQQSLENRDGGGFGLRAVQGRIKLYFGEQYGIRMESIYQEGTVMSVRFPKKFEAQEPAGGMEEER